VDNAVIQVNGQEVPAMDGSSAFFVDLIKAVGVMEQDAHRKILQIANKINITNGEKFITIEPSDHFSVNFTIDFADSYIGKQSYEFSEEQDFGYDIGRARTFGFIEELDHLQKNGLAKGASLDNAIAIGKDGVLNEDGLRYKDEDIRFWTV
jgi:UDP-3-O-[3-hydroxymyristoyl] N-acetylglucosamine deacetylase